MMKILRAASLGSNFTGSYKKIVYNLNMIFNAILSNKLQASTFEKTFVDDCLLMTVCWRLFVDDYWFLRGRIKSSVRTTFSAITEAVLRRYSVKKSALKGFLLDFLFNKVAGLRLQHRGFPVNFAKFLRTPFFIEHRRMLLVSLITTMFYVFHSKVWKNSLTFEFFSEFVVMNWHF